MSDQPQYCFWPYDLFPFVLGGPGQLQADGRFRVTGGGWGATMCIQPKNQIAVLPFEEGEALNTRLRELTKQHQQFVAMANKSFMAQAAELLPALKDRSPYKGVIGA